MIEQLVVVEDENNVSVTRPITRAEAERFIEGFTGIGAMFAPEYKWPTSLSIRSYSLRVGGVE